MADRFERLYELTSNLYSSGSPIIVSAGALLKDKQTGSLIAQIKFQSVSMQNIKALKLSLAAYDVSGKELQGVPDYQYLELDIDNGQEFGANKAIVLPSSVTRSFVLSNIVIIFRDGTTWESSAPFEPLPKPQRVIFTDSELEKQYHIATNKQSQYKSCEDKGLWLCSCGKWNRGTICTHCHISKDRAFAALDMATLTAQMNIRLAEEAKQKMIIAEKEAKRKASEEAAKKVLLKKTKIVVAIVIPIIIIITIFTQWIWPQIIQPQILYKKACDLVESGSYQEAIHLFEEIEGHKNSTRIIEDCRQALLEKYYAEATSLMDSKHYRNAVPLFELTAAQSYKDSESKLKDCTINIITSYQKSTISAGYDHVVGLKEDGTVIATGANDDGQCNTSNWNNIIAVSAGGYHTVGLKADGTVVATGRNDHGECDVSDWKNIIAIYAGSYHTIGLTRDRNIVVAGIYYYYSSGELQTSETWPEVSNWHDIYAVGAGNNFTVVINDDHAVTAIGDNEFGQCNTSHWKDIYALAISSGHTVGLRSNGTTVATGIDIKDGGQCNVDDWYNIIAIAAGTCHTVGLQTDGCVVAVGYNEDGQCNVSDWNNVVAVTAGSYFTVALLEDGSAVAVGNNEYGQCNVSEWEGIRTP